MERLLNMSRQAKREINNLAERVRNTAPTTVHSLLAALLIWLFGVLVFIPMANSSGWQAGLLCSLIITTALTFFMHRAALGFKRLIDTFSVIPARKYCAKWRISQEEASTIFRHTLYIVSGLLVYALYFPLLVGFHPAISGIVLIITLIWIFFLALRILLALSSWFVEKIT
jgi:hypothetical protein